MMGSRLYWRSAGASRRVLLALAALALAALLATRTFQQEIPKEDYDKKFEAARRAHEAFEVIRRERLRRDHPIDPATDPTGSGLIGVHGSPVTTAAGSLRAKQTSVNPNFAALIVEYLLRLDVRKGDVVAVGFSGSFPALNISVLSALGALEVEPIAITSTAASDFGANLPDLLWPDMERLLAKEGLFNTVSIAASLGGLEDGAIGLSEAGRALLHESIERNQLPLIPAATFEESIVQRMELYDQAAGGRRIAAYVNVGGGVVSVGRHRGKVTYRAGINRPTRKAPVDSIIGRFLDRGIPVVHLVRIESLAEQHGLPTAPRTPPRPGDGAIFRTKKLNRVLVGGLLVGLCGTIVFVGRRARARAETTEGAEPPLG